MTERKLLNSRHQPVGRWIAPVRRLAIYLRDGYRCVLCGCDLSHAGSRDITLDHHVPRSLGGTNESSNLYTCCRACNNHGRNLRRTDKERRRVIKHLHMSMTAPLDAAYVILEMRKQCRDRDQSDTDA